MPKKHCFWQIFSLWEHLSLQMPTPSTVLELCIFYFEWMDGLIDFPLLLGVKA